MDPVARMYEARDEDARARIAQFKAPPVRFRASELADCKRKIWYRLSGYVPTPRYGFNDDWGVDGDIHHDITRQQLLAWGVKLGGISQDEDGTTHEDPFVVQGFEHDDVEFDISTRQDGWIYHEDHGWLLLEIKSVGHWPLFYTNKAYDVGWTDANGTKYGPGEAALVAYIEEKKPSYLHQMHAGMAISNIQGVEGRRTDCAYLLLKDRSNCHIGMHTPDQPIIGGGIYKWDDELWDKILSKCAFVKSRVLSGKPPIPEYPPSHKECGYCPFKYLCHNADKRRTQGLTPARVYPDAACGIVFDESEVSNEG